MTLLYTGTDRAILWWKLQLDAVKVPCLQQLGELEIGEMPSFIAFAKDDRFAVALAESANSVSSLRVDEDGSLSLISTQPCPGGPAYLSITPDQRWVLCASYSSGELRVFPFLPGGQLGKEVGCFDSGKMSHCALLDPASELVFVPSKGSDSVYVGRFNSNTGHITEESKILTPIGSGPRHLVFSNELGRAYVANENDCSLLALSRSSSNAPFEIFAHISALPRRMQADDSGADVHVSRDGRFVYMSIRGFNSISVFASLNQGVQLLEHVSTRGDVPRNFCLLDEDLLVVANQESRMLSFFDREQVSGRLKYLGECDIQERVFWVGNSKSY